MPWGSVTFLSPAAGLLALGLALPVLLLWYFLKLRRRPVRVTSTMLWVSAVRDVQANAPFRWIRPSWLLLLHLLVLALLCAALARPAIEAEGEPPGRMVLMIDVSASMSASDAPGGRGGGAGRSRLEQAKEQALNLLGRLPSRTEAMVVAFAARPEPLTSFSRDRTLLRRAIDSVRATDQPADLDAALRLVEAVAAQGGAGEGTGSEGAAAEPATVALLSDGGVESREASGALGRVSFRFLPCGPAPEAAKNNVGIVAFRARRSYENPAAVQVFVRVQGTGTPSSNADGATPGPAPALDVPITLTLDGRSVGAEVLTLAPPVGEGGAAQASASFTVDSAEGGVLAAAIARPDALASDDQAWLVLTPPAAPRIVVVQPDGAMPQADQILPEAMAWFRPRELARLRRSEFELLLTGPGGAALGGAYDLIVFDRVRPTILPALPTLSFGAGLPVPGLSVEPAQRAPTDFAYWLRTHPVMRDVSLSGVTIFQPMRLVLPAEGETAGRAARSTALASGVDGPLIGLVEAEGVRRIVIGFEVTASWWFRELSFPFFMKNAVDYLTLSGDEFAGQSVATTASATVTPTAGATEILARGPVEVRRAVPLGVGSMPLGVLPRAGMYTLDGATLGATGGDRLAVNLLDAGESSIQTRAAVEIAGRSTGGGGLSAVAPKEIWPWLLLLAFILLAAEWVVFAWHARL